MRFIHCADLHFLNCLPYSKLNMKRNLSQRFLDQLKLFELICTYAINNKVKYVLVAGDIFEHYNPNIKERTAVLQLLIKKIEQGVEFILMSGNHDRNTFWSNMEYLEGIKKGLHIVSKESRYVFDDMLLCPFKVGQNLDSIKKDLNGKTPKVLALHGGIAGADMGHGFRPKDGFSLEELQTLNIPYIAMGDYHKSQIWKDKGNYVVYSGSLMAVDFREFDSQQKFFFDVEITDNKPVVKMFKLPMVNPLIMYNFKNDTFTDCTLVNKKESDINFNNAIIKILYDRKQSLEINKLKEKFIKLGASYVTSEPLPKEKIASIDSKPKKLNIKVESNIIDFCNKNNYESDLSIKIYSDMVDKFRLDKENGYAS